MSQNVKFYLLWTQLVGAALEVAANQWECNYVAVLSRKFQAHVELIFKYFAVETVTGQAVKSI